MLITVAILALIVFVYKPINGSLFFGPLIINQAAFAISWYTLFELYSEGFIEPNVYYQIIAMYFMYFITFLVLPKTLGENGHDVFKDIVFFKEDFLAEKIIFSISLLFSLYYSLMLFKGYDTGDERLLLNKESRVLSIFQMMFSLWSIALSSLVYIKSKKKAVLKRIFVNVGLQIISGSKAASFASLLIFLFFYLQNNQFSRRQLMILPLAIAILLVIPSYLMYGSAALEVIFYRVARSADIYDMSFVVGDYKQLIGYYNPISYLLHPFTSLVGTRGYDFPLGAEILSTAGMEVSGMGPNSHSTILALVFFGDCLLCSIGFTLFLCVITFIVFKLAFYSLRIRLLHSFYKIFLFSSLYFSFMNIFFDIGMLSFWIVICILSIPVYFLILTIVRVLPMSKKPNLLLG